MPGRRGKLLLGLAAAVLAAVGGTYLLLSQTRVDVTVGEGEAAVSQEVACGNAFAGGRRAEVPSTTATAPTTAAADATATTAPATTAPPDPATTEGGESAEVVAAEAAEDAAVQDCADAKRPRTIAGGVLTAGGVGAVVILTQLLDSTRFTDT